MAKYFTSRPNAVDLEQPYSEVVLDPDGKPRRLIEERELKLQDARAELQFIRSLPAGRILDVGCGYGFFLSGLQPEWECHGTEMSQHACNEAAKYCRVHFGELSSARYPDGYFDVVNFYHVIEHIADPVPVVDEIWRVLKPGGHFVCATPDFDSALARRFGENYRMLSQPGHITLFSTHSLRLFLEDSGFVVDRVDYPYFETRHFTLENLQRLFDTSRVSPPFYGNHMTFYTRKPLGAETHRTMRKALASARDLVEENLIKIDTVGAQIAAATAAGRAVRCVAASDLPPAAAALVSSFQHTLPRGDATGPAIFIGYDGGTLPRDGYLARVVGRGAADGDIDVRCATPNEMTTGLALIFDAWGRRAA